MTDKFHVLMLGNILPGHDKTDVLQKASKLFKIDVNQVAKMINGRQLIIKKDIDETLARRYVEAITKVGLACTFELQTITTSNSKSDHNKISHDVCPKCGYIFQDENVTECIQCGIIMDKFHKTGNHSNKINSDIKLSGHHGKDTVKQASKAIRQCAGLGSMTIVGAATSVFLPIVSIVIYFFNRDLLSNPLPDNSAVNMAVSRIEFHYSLSLLILSLSISLYYFVIYPARNGRTWAQKFLDIEIHSSNPIKNINVFTWIIRAVGNYLHIIPALLLAGLAEYSSLEILYYPLLLLYLIIMLIVYNRGKRSIADILSSTYQVQPSLTFGKPKIGMWIIIIVSLSISVASHSFSRMIITPTKSFEPTAEELATHRKNILEKIFILQKAYFDQHDYYTEDPMELLRRYVNMRSLDNLQLVKAVTEGMIHLELSSDGYRAGIPIGKPPGAYYIYTQDGDQGIHEGYIDRVSRKLVLE